jgi:hypothetical protein
VENERPRVGGDVEAEADGSFTVDAAASSETGK